MEQRYSDSISDVIKNSGEYIVNGTSAVRAEYSAQVLEQNKKTAPQQQQELQRENTASLETKVVLTATVMVAAVVVLLIAVMSTLLIGANVANNAINQKIGVIEKEISGLNACINSNTSIEEVNELIQERGMVKAPLLDTVPND